MHWIVWPIMMTAFAQPSEATGGFAPNRREAIGFLEKTLRMDGETYAYRVYVPPDYKPGKPWPTIIFLHGSGERGRDGVRQTKVGIGPAIRRNHRRIPAIVIMPQCRAKKYWTGPMADMVLGCLEQTSREYNLDPERLYVTGLSLGGAGAWHLGARLSDQVAAVVPICGFGDVDDAPRLAKVPIWCFHGAADDAVPVNRSREMVAAIRKAGGDIQYTEYPRGKHNVWDKAYNDPALWKWMFEQRRSGSGETVNTAKDSPMPTRP